MKPYFSLLLLSAAVINTAYADDPATKVVSTKAELLQAVSLSSPYSTVIVSQSITDLSNVILKDSLTLKSSTGNSIALEATPGATLLTVGKNDHIEGLTLTVHDPQQPRAIQNKAGSSVGNLTVKSIITNGAVDIDLTDGSTDSTIDFINNEVNLSPYNATDNFLIGSLTLAAENGSHLQVNKISNNAFTTTATDNLGIYSRVLSNGSIDFHDTLDHNTITTSGSFSAGIYNDAQNGHITVSAPVIYNTITLNGAQFAIGIYNRSIQDSSIDITSNYFSNNIKANRSIAHGFDFEAQMGAKIHLSGAIQQNFVVTPGYNSVPFFAFAIGSGYLDLAGNAITQNTFQSGDQPTILNNATDQGTIDFGFGSVAAVTTNLTSHNTLMAADNSQTIDKVANHSDATGVIK